jgi:hypothetical protein
MQSNGIRVDTWIVNECVKETAKQEIKRMNASVDTNILEKRVDNYFNGIHNVILSLPKYHTLKMQAGIQETNLNEKMDAIEKIL